MPFRYSCRSFSAVATTVAAALFFAPANARADKAPQIEHMANGSVLLSYCARSTRFSQSACLGYIAGISDAMIDRRIIGKGAAYQACIPREVTAGARAAKVIPWLTRHVDDLHKPAAGLVAQALAAAFPCKR